MEPSFRVITFLGALVIRGGTKITKEDKSVVTHKAIYVKVFWEITMFVKKMLTNKRRLFFLYLTTHLDRYFSVL